MKRKVLVIGGTGKTGRKVVQKLNALGYEVRIGSRSAEPAFNWENPQGWEKALEGIDMVYITFQPDLAVPGALEAIEELVRQAKRSGISKMVLLSGKGEREAELCEQVVIHSGIDYTIIRASWFNQNFSESFFLEPILAGHVSLPQPEAKVPYVDTDDIAEVAVAALIEEQHNGRIYELTGPRLLTFRDIIEDISRETGRSIQYSPITMQAYSKMLEEAGLPDDYIWLINYLFTEVLAKEENSMISPDIENVLGRKATDFSDYVKRTAATGIWNPAT
jgi:uncharacterized protein YbjT (DUF2867 family)